MERFFYFIHPPRHPKDWVVDLGLPSETAVSALEPDGLLGRVQEGIEGFKLLAVRPEELNGVLALVGLEGLQPTDLLGFDIGKLGFKLSKSGFVGNTFWAGHNSHARSDVVMPPAYHPPPYGCNSVVLRGGNGGFCGPVGLSGEGPVFCAPALRNL